MYAHLLEHTNTKVIVYNNSNWYIYLPRKQRLGTISKVFFGNRFSTELEADTAKILPTKLSFRDRTGVVIAALDPLLKTRLLNGIRIYSDKKAVICISRLIDKFSSIWELSGFVQISFKRWMTVPLCDNWQDKISSIKLHVYPLRLESKKLVDDTFNKLQYQGRLTYTQTHTPFSFPIFVV